MSEGRTSLRDYLHSRPVAAELEAIERAIAIAGETGCSLHVVHVSTGRGVQARRGGARRRRRRHLRDVPPLPRARRGGCASSSGWSRSARRRCARARTSTTSGARVLDGLVDFVASDHSPSPPELKQGDDAFAAWGGIAGCQTLLRVLLTEGLPRGLSLEAIATLSAEAPARRFRLAGQGVARSRRRRRSRGRRPGRGGRR